MRNARSISIHLCALSLAAAATACAVSKDETARRGGLSQETAPAPRAGATSNLQWKRQSTFEADLTRALSLDPAAVCQEFGKESCIRKVHVVPLGGNEPFDTGMLEASAEPLATTPTVVDRIVLTACSNRVTLDARTPAEAAVFKGVQLDAPAPAPSDPAVRALVTQLFQRFLARDPRSEEVDTVAALARDDADAPIAGADFAKLACLAVGTTAEFIFF